MRGCSFYTQILTIPVKWFSNETKDSINSFLGEGTYEEHGNFNPNNNDRISLPWTVKDVTAILTKLEKEYSASMDKYTQGTGGGPSADENYVAWQQRDECNVIKYSNQPSHIYLTVVKKMG